MTYDKEKMTITVGPDTDLNKDSFQHFEEVYRRLIADNPNCSPEIIEEYEKLKKANKAVKDFETLTAISDLARADIDANVEDGLFRVKKLALLSMQDNVSAATKNDWSVMSKYFNCSHKLTEANVASIRDALRQYHSRNKLGAKLLPLHLSSVFDNLYQPASKISKSISIKDKFALMLQKIQSLSRIAKGIIAFILVWTVYVSYRSYDDHQLLGYDLEQWRGNEFFANLLIIPLSIAALVFIVRWVFSDKK